MQESVSTEATSKKAPRLADESGSTTREWSARLASAKLSPEQTERIDRLRDFSENFIPNKDFLLDDAESIILGPLPEGHSEGRLKAPAGIPAYLAALYDTPLLTQEQEHHLFRKYNYLKYRILSVVEDRERGLNDNSVIEEVEGKMEEALEARNHIVQANLRLVVSMARKTSRSAPERFEQIVSDGNESLMKAVERFDYGRGFRFSTYAGWAISKNNAGFYKRELKHRQHFRATSDEVLSRRGTTAASEYAQEIEYAEARDSVTTLFSTIDDREQRIIVSRFGLDGTDPLTLDEIAREMGLSRQGVANIIHDAEKKLKAAALLQGVNLPFDLRDEDREIPKIKKGKPGRLSKVAKRILLELDDGPCSLGELKCLLPPHKEEEVLKALTTLEDRDLVKKDSSGLPLYRKQPGTG